MEKLLARFNEISEEAEAIREELDVLMETEPFDQEAFDAAAARADTLASEKKDLELRLETYRARQAEIDNIRTSAAHRANTEDGDSGHRFHINRDLGDVYDLAEVRGVGPEQSAELRSRALTAVEKTSDFEFESAASDKASRSKERITWLLEHRDDRNASIARLVLATNSPVYKQAWLKAVTDRKDALTPQERKVLDRAMSLTDGAGGFAVPMPIDPTLIQLGDGAAAGVRQYARVIPITVDVWRGLASTELSASWDAEGVEVSDDTTTFTQPDRKSVV